MLSRNGKAPCIETLSVLCLLLSGSVSRAAPPVLHERQRLTDAPTPDTHRPFDPFLVNAGNLVALDSLRALVGVPYENNENGAIHVYRRDPSGTPENAMDDVWVAESVITVTDSYIKAFGRHLTLDGDRFAATASSFTVPGRCQGEPFDACGNDDDCPPGVCGVTGGECRGGFDCPGTCTFDGAPCMSDAECSHPNPDEVSVCVHYVNQNYCLNEPQCGAVFAPAVFVHEFDGDAWNRTGRIPSVGQFVADLGNRFAASDYRDLVRVFTQDEAAMPDFPTEGYWRPDADVSNSEFSFCCHHFGESLAAGLGILFVQTETIDVHYCSNNPTAPCSTDDDCCSQAANCDTEHCEGTATPCSNDTDCAPGHCLEGSILEFNPCYTDAECFSSTCVNATLCVQSHECIQGRGAAIYTFHEIFLDWVAGPKIVSEDLRLESFGESISYHDDRIAVGNSLPGGYAPGMAYVFRRERSNLPDLPQDETWQEEARITVDEETQDPQGFGTRVALFGRRLLVSRPGTAGFSGLRAAGSVHVFRLDDNGTPLHSSDDQWLPELKLAPTKGGARDRFGRAVAIHGRWVLVFGDRGPAFVYLLPPLPPPTFLDLGAFARLQNCFGSLTPSGASTCHELDAVLDDRINLDDFVYWTTPFE